MAAGFWYRPTNDIKNLRLIIMKRPEGDLKVWPEARFASARLEKQTED
jgi:hypothetical protein